MAFFVRTGRGRTGAGAVLAAALLCGGALAGCGSSDSGGDRQRRAAEQPAEQPAMSPVAAVREATKKSGKLTSFRYRMTGRTPADGRVEVDAAMSLKPFAMSMKMRALDEGADAAVEIRVVGDAFYLDGGKEAAAEADSKRWIKFDKSLMGADAPGMGGNLVTDRPEKNPAGETDLLAESEDVKRVGDETVDGVRTTRYSGTITIAQLRESLADESPKIREKREKKLAEFEAMGVDKLTMDMWIDPEQGHTKRFRMRGEGDQGPLDVTITFLDVNKPVTVAVPPAAETMDMAQLAEDAEN
ncbi:LppX_LprAFG lipoprotein [Streptomyces sp. NPDC018031]|uniref:LppX_LprAFG lipoprotein n=1 Tax=Streptomyces sp. NPDC018031 TaxID=3365033 RepID=UPI0037875C9E